MATWVGTAFIFLLCKTVSIVSFVQEPDCTSLTPQECEAQAKEFVEVTYEKQASQMCQQTANANFEYMINLKNPEKEQASTNASIVYSKFIFEQWNTVLRHYNYSEFVDPSLKRQLTFLNIVGTAALNDTDLTQYNTIVSTMSRIYGTAKICPFSKQVCDIANEGLNLDPDIESIMTTSRNASELAYVWKAWHDASGKQIREVYKKYIALSNKAAVANGLNNNGDLWLTSYEAANFKAQVAKVWDTVKTLYDELYGYVRFKLRQVYPDEFVDPTDPIPAHILGNMWAQSWEAIYPIVIPHPDEPGFDVTDKLKEKFNATEQGVRAMYQEANQFFMNLGLDDMSISFGDRAMIVRPENRDVSCHGTAWDFCDRKDYRITMCTKIKHEDYINIHHELGHIQYYLLYKDKPMTFRDGANSGFHEAIGDVISLSVASPRHMAKLGYLPSGDLNATVTENFLMQKALEKIAFLPFGYLIDAYRWKLFDGSASLDKMEYEWLKIRNEVQGLRPPVVRSESDFDPGAKYHVSNNVPYIAYFVSFIIQFQIHKALCLVAKQYDPTDPEKPLCNCDIAGNQEAGEIMRKLLETGASENWQNVLESAIGTREMDSSAIIEYFTPLTKYLEVQRAEHNYSLKWKMDAFKAYSKAPIEETTAMSVQTTSMTPSEGTTTPTEGKTTDETNGGGVGLWGSTYVAGLGFW